MLWYLIWWPLKSGLTVPLLVFGQPGPDFTKRLESRLCSNSKFQYWISQSIVLLLYYNFVCLWNEIEVLSLSTISTQNALWKPGQGQYWSYMFQVINRIPGDVFIKLLRRISKLIKNFKCIFPINIQLYFNKAFHAYEKLVFFHKHEKFNWGSVSKNR